MSRYFRVIDMITNVEGLIQEIREYEFNPNVLGQIIETSISEISFEDIGSAFAYTIINVMGGVEKLHIRVSKNRRKNLDDVIKSIIHECVHIGTKIYGHPDKESHDKIERAIEEKTDAEFERHRKEYLRMFENLRKFPEKNVFYEILPRKSIN